jgi:hypothetical protein
MKINFRIFSILAVATLCIFSAFFCSSDPFAEERNNKIISESPTLKKLENMCLNIPKPKSFILVKRGASSRGRGLISYYYKTNENSRIIKLFFRDYFLQNGWEEIQQVANSKDMEFKSKETGQFIDIQHLDENDVSFAIHCKF